MDGLLGYFLTAAAIVWCTYSSSGMFCAVGRMRRMRALVAYPLALFYVGFGIMGIFSSRGSGNLAKVTTSVGGAGGASAGGALMGSDSLAGRPAQGFGRFGAGTGPRLS